MNFASIRRLFASGRCAWVLAWALCLPVAQGASIVHAFQHVRGVTAEERDAPAQLPLGNCELCLLGAAIGGAAPLAEVPPPPLAPLPQAVPVAVVATEVAASPPVFYSSRAPPLLHA